MGDRKGVLYVGGAVVVNQRGLFGTFFFSGRLRTGSDFHNPLVPESHVLPFFPGSTFLWNFQIFLQEGRMTMDGGFPIPVEQFPGKGGV